MTRRAQNPTGGIPQLGTDCPGILDLLAAHVWLLSWLADRKRLQHWETAL